jgi:hypothetical protein
MEETNMIPKELIRRVDRIERADLRLGQARLMAADYVADPERGFADYADDECELCATAKICGSKQYDDRLLDAVEGYRAAGLGHLADRVDRIRSAPPAEAWTAFDEENLGSDL